MTIQTPCLITGCRICTPLDETWSRFARLRWYRQGAERWVRRMEAVGLEGMPMERGREWLSRLRAAESAAAAELEA